MTDTLRLRLGLPALYDLPWVLGFLADRATPALERVTATEVVRVVRLGGDGGESGGGGGGEEGGGRAGGGVAILRVRPGPDPAAARRLAVEATAVTPAGEAPAWFSAVAVRRLVRRMFDLDTDLAAFLELAGGDPILGPSTRRHPGLRLPQLPDPFEAAVRAVVGQQVSVAGARTVVDRLIRELGEALPGDSGLLAFPAPAILAAAPPERITALGLTRAKAATLRGVAAATRDGILDWEALRHLPQEEAQGRLVALPGIGPWTASYLRMRALGDRDAFPAADLGILKALAALAPPASGPSPFRPTPAAAAAALTRAEAWRPYRAYAAIHLWRSLAP